MSVCRLGAFCIIIIMIFLKNILGARVAHNSLARFFSAKKSNEQLAYYQQRIESLPNFSIKFLI
jgi:hypothetical protein